MKYFRVSLATLLALFCVQFGAASLQAQNQSSALERGYRTGYSDGYNAGYKDSSDHAARNYENKDEYQRADRSYNQAWGSLEDFRDGYQQGFEAGYGAGFDRQPFESSIPAGLERRTTGDQSTQSTQPAQDNSGTNSQNAPATNGPVNTTIANGPVFIPRDTILVLELDSNLSTDVSQQGDRFQAHVVAPAEYQGAIIDGHLTEVRRPGRTRGVAQLQMTFDSIRFADGRSSNFSAIVVEVIDRNAGGEVGSVDPEGGVRGKDSTKDDITKVGAAAGIGAIIGAIAGGGKGAAIGAAIGGSVGSAGVLTKRGKDIRLDRGQQLKIRASTDTRTQ